MATAYLFPGQGSQAKGMGADLFSRFPDWTDQADAELGYSVRELCLTDPREELGLTAFTQPAMFVVNAMAYRARVEDGEPAPAFVAGHSLGEYNALVAAGVCDFGTGLRLVRQRGQLMSTVSGGGMAAVVGMDPGQIETLLAASEEGRRIDVANFNSFEQTVVAGRKDDIAAIRPAFVEAGARFIPLKVSAPFHSRYMTGAMEEFASVLASVTFRAPVIPVVSNVTGTPYDAAAIRETLSRQIGACVRWLDSVVYMLEHDVETFVEVGPGTVLTKLVAQIRKRHDASRA